MSFARIITNPILVREIQHRMRDTRTFIIPAIYTAVLGLVTIGIYLVAVGQSTAVPQSTVQGYEIGTAIFYLIITVQMFLVVLIVPSVSAASITAERDKGTLTPLLVTPMARVSILIGKLVAPVLYMFLLLFASLPFAALSFGFGGTDLRLLAVTFGCLVTAVLFFAALGLMVSTLITRTVPALMTTYGLVALLVVGSLIGDAIVNFLAPGSEKIVFLYLNPFTPIFMTMKEADLKNWEVAIWITPVLQLALGALFALIAGRRISRMRQ